MNNLALAYEDLGLVDRAIPILAGVLEIQKARLSPDHADTLATMNTLGHGLRLAKRLEEALPVLREALERRKKALAPDHLLTISSMNNLALVCRDTGRHDEALGLLEDALGIQRAKGLLDHPETLATMNNLAMVYQDANRIEEAVSLLEQAFRLRSEKLGRAHPDTRISMENLAVAYMGAERFEKAEPLLLEVAEARRKKVDAATDPALRAEGRIALAGLLAQAGDCLLRSGKYPEAERAIRECVQIREELQPDVWTTANARSLLGDALLGRKMYEDAERLLISGFEEMKRREATIPEAVRSARLQAAGARILRLYEALGRPDKVSEWRRKLD